MRVKYSVTKARLRPESAVPSEYSVVSDTSSCEGGGEDKAVSPREEGEAGEEGKAGEEGEAGGEKKEQDRRERVRRAHAIATELLDTEKHYVAVLHLIDQVATPHIIPTPFSPPYPHLSFFPSVPNTLQK